jgi:uncharacterized protein (TIGR03083 family)
MDKRSVAAAVDQERADLAGFLETLTADEWQMQSLCQGWTVKEVVAHLTLFDIPAARVTVEFLRYGGSLARIGRETARRRAADMSNEQLVALLRSKVGNRKHPIGTNYLDPLCDVLVHGQDIAVPLGRRRAMPTDAAVAAAERVATMAFWSGKRRRVRQLRLVATDADWTYGDGALVRGPIAVLLLVLTGRRARLDELAGEGVGLAW